MRTETETKTIYVSDDGKRKSYSQSEIENYEKRQLKEIFERRTIVANISTSTTLYLFKKGDIKTFKEFHPEAYLGATSEDEEGYFVYIYDSTYDDIGDSYHLYHQRRYETMTLEKIEHYKNILDNITDGVMVGETGEYMLKIIDKKTNTFYGKDYNIQRVVKIFSNEGQYRVRVDQTKNIEGRGSLKSFDCFKCNSLQEAQEKADYIIKTENYKVI